MHLKSKSLLSSDFSSAITGKSFQFGRIVPLTKIFFLFSFFNKGTDEKKISKKLCGIFLAISRLTDSNIACQTKILS